MVRGCETSKVGDRFALLVPEAVGLNAVAMTHDSMAVSCCAICVQSVRALAGGFNVGFAIPRGYSNNVFRDTTMMRLVMAAVTVVLAAGSGLAQDTAAQARAREALQLKLIELNAAATNVPPPTTGATEGVTPTATQGAPSALEEVDEDGWSFALYTSTYLQQSDRDYFQPTITADRGWLHLEGRYNYEDFETVSFFVGYNITFGQEISVTLTPMVGGAFGEVEGVAPAYRLSAEWRKLALYSEGEYFFNADNSDDGYFYTWSELNLDVAYGFHLGLVMQKETSEDVRRGFSVGYGWEMAKLGEVDLTVYFFDLDKGEEMYVFGANFSF